jgi:hypothetical protein
MMSAIRHEPSSLALRRFMIRRAMRIAPGSIRVIGET